MTGIGLVTKGKICSHISSFQGGGYGGGIIYRDRYRKPTKKECEALYFPKVYMELIKMINEGCEIIHLPKVHTDLMGTLKEQEIKFSVNVKFDKISE